MTTNEETNINITDRRLRKSNEKILRQLLDSMKGLQEAWDFYLNSPVTSETLDHLVSILMTVNFIKDLCINKNLPGLAVPVEKLEMLLTDLSNTPEDNALQVEISLKISHLNQDIEILNKDYPENKSTPVASIPEPEVAVVVSNPYAKKVFIISNEQKFINECSVQISYYGYSVISYDSLENYAEGLKQHTPSAIIADLDLFQESSQQLNQYASANIPMIMISKSGEFKARLQSVQAGSMAFFVKPVNISLLLDKLDAIISSSMLIDAPKVLVIDDSKTVAEFLSKTLRKSGMIVQVENTPESGLAAIPKFNPDLILMDIYMPICDGEDLCRIIRQSEFFTSIPIVFLSSETDIKKQLNAMQIGADDFLTKDIEANHLVTSITTRIQRHKILSSFMVRDSLTGLLNHTASKKQLEQMMSQAYMLNLPLVYVMIDIDNFKVVNDTYGHPAGDRVIKSLARLLQKRLRKSDSIGRYGGEEYAVVLWETNIENAQIVLNELREDFSKIEHIHEGKSFYTTFSAGIAQFPTYMDATNISKAADKALYAAKNNGRNQVCIAQEPIEKISYQFTPLEITEDPFLIPEKYRK